MLNDPEDYELLRAELTKEIDLRIQKLRERSQRLQMEPTPDDVWRSFGGFDTIASYTASNIWKQ